MRWLHTLTLAAGYCLALSQAEAQTHVQMLVPGFTVQELPVRLSNINNLRFSPNGRLFALSYDGRVLILRDTDGDGLEDKATVFWDQPTLRVPVGMAWSSEGLYVSSQGKVSLLIDADKDGRADTEEIIAAGWPPTDVASGGVDATGVTLDRKGNAYFALLVADYSNPYRLKDGTPHYDLSSARGTIQKWNKATRKLETIATGLRVPYQLAFNRDGDLFCTDQEGETWCPNGNPLDELNQIVEGRNYGFPPRHEKYLPQLISEPPVVGFGPQHQSSCGFLFNEKSAGRRSFGPDWWEGDALVAGESRGKIWRVRLVKTPSGYVGKATLVARLNMLTTDVALSPKGDLYVSCHSGQPDWGTGPKGEGKLFKISFADAKAPQPQAIWAAGPMEVRVAFDRRVDPTVTNLAPEMTLTFGEHTRAADRYETLRPPYKAVEQQQQAPRGKLRIRSAQLGDDGRTLVLATDPQTQAATYALQLPGVRARNSTETPATIDLDYELSGVQADWRADKPASAAIAPTKLAWSGWLPHIDSEINRAFISETAEHQPLFNLASQKGTLRLRANLKLPAGRVTLRAQRNAPFQVSLAGQAANGSLASAGRYTAELTIVSDGQPTPLLVDLETGPGRKPLFHAAYSTEIDPTPRPIPLDWFQLPWSPSSPPPLPPAMAAAATNLAGGDFHRGQLLFTSEQLKCGTCHKMRGVGGEIGPDLSNLIHRDAASVLRDIKDPNATIHPDYVAFRVRLRDGAELTGFIPSESETSVRIRGVDGKETLVSPAEIREMSVSAVSAMPSGLIDGLGEAQVRDLLTFLVTEPADLPPGAGRSTTADAQAAGPDLKKSGAPPLRTRAEVQAVLAKSAQGPRPQNIVPLSITLVAGKQDHGPGEHDYPAWQTNWVRLLSQADATWISTAWQWPSTEQFKQADVLVFYFWNHDWTTQRLQQLDAFLERGGGVVVLHSACIEDKEPERLAEHLGLAAHPVRTKYRHGPIDLKFDSSSGHPITFGVPQLHLVDETYWPMIGNSNRVEILATAEEEGKSWPMLWTFEKGPGRVFGSVLGHYAWTFDDPLFRILVLRGIAWAAGAASTRFENLATRGITLLETN